MGLVDPAQMVTNRAAEPGDAIVLTKGLGTGLVIAAHQGRRCSMEVFSAACASMVELNRVPAEAAAAVRAKAATDVTGFGLAGHAFEMAEASGVTIRLELGRLPVLPGAEELAREENLTGAVATNREFVGRSVTIEPTAEGSPRMTFLYDPQTSGGLLVAVKQQQVEEYLARCRDGGLDAVAVVGSVIPERESRIIVTA